MSLEEKREKKLNSKEIYKGKILDVFVDDVLLPNGNTSIREVIRHCRAAAVLAFNDKDECILEEQYRYPYDEMMIEVPAGKADKNEDDSVTAKRELEEETGYKAGELIDLGLFYPTVAYTDEVIHLYLAKNLIKTKQHLDFDEELDYKFVPFEEVKKMVLDGRIKDGKTIAIIARYMIKYNK